MAWTVDGTSAAPTVATTNAPNTERPSFISAPSYACVDTNSRKGAQGEAGAWWRSFLVG
jgi:hypothetical protein